MKIKNNHIEACFNFLMKIGVKGKKGIDRTRVALKLQEHYKKLGKEELGLVKDYATLDDEGNPKKGSNGGFIIEDKESFKQAQNDLFAEYYVIDDVNLKTSLQTVKKLVNEYDEELKGSDALGHFYLVEALENIDQENAE